MMRKVLMVITLAAVLTLTVLELTYQDGPAPDVVYPMANQHISWQK